MKGTTEYGSSTVLLTSVASEKEKAKEIEGFPCVSPLDDGTYGQSMMFILNISAVDRK